MLDYLKKAAMSNDEVLIEEQDAKGGKIGFAQLNSKRTLNSLNPPLIDKLTKCLSSWAEREDIVCVVLYSAGDKAFCVGGNVVELYHSILASDSNVPLTEADSFFAAEYRLQYQIHTYPKPILCWSHGIAMGSGFGLMAGASHRVVTPETMLAMPEIAIGLFPDAGATWFLNRMPARIGLYLGVTGTRLDSIDAVQLGLADYFITHEKRDAVFAALIEQNWDCENVTSNNSLLAHTLRDFDDECHSNRPSPSLNNSRLDHITRVTDNFSMLSFYEAMVNAGQTDPWIRAGVENIEYGSPTSMALAYAQLQSGRLLSLKQAFMREFNQAAHCIRQPDLAEGVRALLVDKDRAPKWMPATLQELTAEYVNKYFYLPPDYQNHPLADL